MSFKNIKLNTKIISGYILISFILLGIIFWNYKGLSEIISIHNSVTKSEKLVEEMLQREIDHLIWIQKVGMFRNDENIQQIEAEKDHHQCKFGKWYFSDSKQEIISEIPQLENILADIEKPHQELHNSVIQIQEFLDKGADFRSEANDYFKNVTVNQVQRVQSLLHQIIETAQEHSRQKVILEDEKASNIKTVTIASVFLGLAFTILTSFLFSRMIVRPVKEMTGIAEGLALGDVQQKVVYESEDEIGILANSFRKLIEEQRRKSQAAEEIANGNLDFMMAIASNHDILGNSMMLMKDKIQLVVDDISSLIKHIEIGKLDRRVDITRHLGAFQNIVQGMNKLLDQVLKPIGDAVIVLDKTARRDLRARMTGSYQGDHEKLKTVLNQAIENLDSGLKQVVINSEQVASASNEISSGSQELSQATSEQASSLEEISSSIHEITALSKKASEDIKVGQDIAEATSKAAVKGQASMRRLSNVIERIKKSSDETGNIVKTIDGIAFQTNLLALNAAVEAARAGEAGKGFAVVAEEVRNLAIRSAEAAKNSTQMIGEALKNSEEGVRVNREVLTELDNIHNHTQKVNSVISHVAEASVQQQYGISQISMAIEQLNQLTQQNAASSEESASIAKTLSSQAQNMKDLVDTFTLSDNPNSLNSSPALEEEYQYDDSQLVEMF